MAVMQPSHRRKFDGVVFTLSSIESKSVAKVLAKQMRQSGRLVRLVPVAFNRVAIYVRWQERGRVSGNV